MKSTMKSIVLTRRFTKVRFLSLGKLSDQHAQVNGKLVRFCFS
jgi:hypothetical protein